jgi:hypothetical protein
MTHYLDTSVTMKSGLAADKTRLANLLAKSANAVVDIHPAEGKEIFDAKWQPTYIDDESGYEFDFAKGIRINQSDARGVSFTADYTDIDFSASTTLVEFTPDPGFNSAASARTIFDIPNAGGIMRLRNETVDDKFIVRLGEGGTQQQFNGQPVLVANRRYVLAVVEQAGLCTWYLVSQAGTVSEIEIASAAGANIGQKLTYLGSFNGGNGFVGWIKRVAFSERIYTQADIENYFDTGELIPSGDIEDDLDPDIGLLPSRPYEFHNEYLSDVNDWAIELGLSLEVEARDPVTTPIYRVLTPDGFHDIGLTTDGAGNYNLNVDGTDSTDSFNVASYPQAGNLSCLRADNGNMVVMWRGGDGTSIDHEFAAVSDAYVGDFDLLPQVDEAQFYITYIRTGHSNRPLTG